jgi:hypothetical protein
VSFDTLFSIFKRRVTSFVKAMATSAKRRLPVLSPTQPIAGLEQRDKKDLGPIMDQDGTQKASLNLSRTVILPV